MNYHEVFNSNEVHITSVFSPSFEIHSKSGVPDARSYKAMLSMCVMQRWYRPSVMLEPI